MNLMHDTINHLKSAFLAFSALAILILTGCEESEIKTYKTSKYRPALVETENERQHSAHSGHSHHKHTMMAVAIFYKEQRNWFFKLMDLEKKMKSNHAQFLEFVNSVKFNEEGLPEWTIPDNCTIREGSGMRHATLVFADGVECAISSLTNQRFDLLANVNRWMGQLQHGALSKEELPSVSEEKLIHGIKATLLVLPPEGDHEAQGDTYDSTPANTDAPFRANVPESWTSEAASGMRLASFKLADDKITLSVITLGTGVLSDNVNRWRRQVGLDPADEAKIKADALKLKMDDSEGYYVKIANKENDQGIYAAILPRNGQYWYFTAKGPASALEKYDNEIVGFLKSIKFK